MEFCEMMQKSNTRQAKQSRCNIAQSVYEATEACHKTTRGWKRAPKMDKPLRVAVKPKNLPKTLESRYTTVLMFGNAQKQRKQ